MRTTILSLFILLAGMGAASADQLLIEAIREARAEAPSGPTQGTTMDQVRARYGAPGDVLDAVGDPPITRWEYPDFIVYFEYDNVIHTVTRR